MREIIFRGKRNSGEWVYGDYEYNPAKDIARIHHYDKDGMYVGQVIVDKDTVGQYTGLCDKHGNKIFEGDIVRVYDWTSVFESEYSGEVTMYRGAWVVEHEIYGFTACPALCFDDFAGRKTEVIGNIYDKKEEQP